jgi:hypothetical protein
MTRTSRRKLLVTTLAAMLVLGAALVSPSSAHDTPNIGHNWRRHYRQMAKRIFYTKATSDTRFVNAGEQASDSALLDGLGPSAFAAAAHDHAGEDVTSGTVAEARIAAALARDAEVFGIVTDADGPNSGLDADLLDGQSSTAFAAAAHTHAGDDIASGTIAEVRIEAALTRDAEVLGIVTANDGPGSGLDADTLDGLSSDAFAVAGTESVRWFKETADGIGTAPTTERVVFTAPADLTITEVLIEPAATLTANATNHATIIVSRRDADGSDRTTIDSVTTQPAGTGNWTAFGTISLGGVTTASVSAGQKVSIEITKSGVGVVVPVMAIQVEYTVD